MAKFDWKTSFAALAALLAAFLGGNVTPPLVPTPQPVPVVVEPVKPVEPATLPESFVITKDGKRIESKPLEEVAATLADGKYEVLGVPKIGEPFVRRVVLIAAEGVPAPAPPLRPADPVVVRPPVETPTTPVPSEDISAAVYVYEKDDGAPPSSVVVALDRLNRERHILATAVDDDVVDGDGETPDQYKVPFAAAKEYKLPVLVLIHRSGAPTVVKAPKTEQEVWEAIK